MGARPNWKSVLNKQRFEETLQQQRDATTADNLCEESTHVLQ